MPLAVDPNVLAAIRAQQHEPCQESGSLTVSQFILVCRHLGLLAARVGVNSICISDVRAAYNATLALGIRQRALQKSAMKSTITTLEFTLNHLPAGLLSVVASKDCDAAPNILKRFLPDNLKFTTLSTKEHEFVQNYLLLRCHPR
jgi:hypothetical protein